MNVVATAEKREYRSFTTGEVIVAFARYGVATDVIGRAIAVQSDRVETVCRRAVENGTLSMMPPKTPADLRGALSTEVVHLRERVDELESLVREMNAETGDEELLIDFNPHLTTTERKIVGLLMKFSRLSKTRIFESLYGNRPNDAPEPKIVDVLVCKIRKKFAQTNLGVAIKTIWGFGYAIEPEDIKRLREYLAPAPTPALAQTTEGSAS